MDSPGSVSASRAARASAKSSSSSRNSSGDRLSSPRGDLSRDDRGEPLPVLGQVHDLAAGSIMRSAGYAGSFIER